LLGGQEADKLSIINEAAASRPILGIALMALDPLALVEESNSAGKAEKRGYDLASDRLDDSDP